MKNKNQMIGRTVEVRDVIVRGGVGRGVVSHEIMIGRWTPGYHVAREDGGCWNVPASSVREVDVNLSVEIRRP